ncbi:restriction endonuclease [Paraburkholderia fungorum]|uniref:restriction endonuclease n=1 Tax=Paraburkholderia fungorum TaxID=134537 RepID=UPI001C1EF93D|nr:restriction endonuclease [Paraburkholderia fungorum]MBU7440913.1 restriction endonuclease [Paraburkholderia fungorum]
MAAIDQPTVQAFFEAGDNGTTTAAKGRALEDLICYLFSQVPGVSITRRNEMNAFETEEIDVALWNDAHNDGFFFLPNIILIECKNWSAAVGSIEVNWFDSKLRNRGLDFGILVAANGVTGNPEQVSAAHYTIAAALKEGRRLIVFTKEEILAFSEAAELVLSVKEKLCDLAVKGTIL